MVRFPQNIPDDELRRYLRTMHMELGLGGGLYAEATLSADLASGATVTIGGKTFNGKFIRSTYELVSGTTIGGIWNGTDYSIIAWDACETVA